MHTIFLTANTEFDYKVWIGFKTTFGLAEKVTLSNKCPSTINVLLKLIYILTHIVDDNVQMKILHCRQIRKIILSPPIEKYYSWGEKYMTK